MCCRTAGASVPAGGYRVSGEALSETSPGTMADTTRPYRGGTPRWVRRSCPTGSTCPIGIGTGRSCGECLDALKGLLEERRFERPRNLMGLEIELNLADADGLPRMLNTEVLQRIGSQDFQTELGQFNLEVNIVPHRLSGRVLDQLAEELRTGLGYADRQAREEGAADRDDRHPADAHRRGPGLLEPVRTSTATRCSTTRSWPRAARRSCSTSTGVERLIRTSPSIAPKPPAHRCSCISR